MQIPLQISMRDIPRSEAIESHIREKVDKLEQFYDRMTSCRVTLEMPHKHKHQGKLMNVRIDITLPQGEINVNRHANEDAYVAIRDAFDAARRQLEDYARKQRGKVKRHAEPLHGHVDRVFKEEGYGFISTEEGQEFYFSSENMVNAALELLQPGDEVQFIEDAGAEGLQAKRVSTGKHHAS